ncbi:MAG: c-type cytochrome [Gammaproteobacteria bacterium]|nr:c-type cytochrome [Gammaproteobacteria bacterium]
MSVRNPAISALMLVLGACSSPDLTPLEAGGGAIVAKEVSGELPLDPDHSLWREAVPKEVALYPQRSVEPYSGIDAKLPVRVRALHNGSAVALRLEWEDATAARERDIGTFADAAAVQWPVEHGPGVGLPYIGMGDAGHPVALWLWRADGTAEQLAAEGFGTLTAQPSQEVRANGAWRDGVWRVVLTRALAAGGEHAVELVPDRQGLVPLALAVWSGEDAERDGLKRLSAWRVLHLGGSEVDPAYVQELRDAPLPSGDPERGRRLMAEKGCVACHAFPGNPAQPTTGPGLRYAGGIHRADYLSESLREPSEVIVPGKGFSTAQDGRRTSLMPPFQGSAQEREDLVAYLKTLRR